VTGKKGVRQGGRENNSGNEREQYRMEDRVRKGKRPFLT